MASLSVSSRVGLPSLTTARSNSKCPRRSSTQVTSQLSSRRSSALRSTSPELGSIRTLSSPWLGSDSLTSPNSVSVIASPRPSRIVSVHARNGGGDDSVEPTDRIIASVGYFLPFIDGMRYGRFLYLQYPFFRAILDPVVPLVQLYNGVPFAGFIAFFALYLGVIQNQSMSRYVRYNCMQAVVLDILMILPSLFERIFNFKDGVGFQLTVVFYNTVFLYLLACFVFGVGSCLLGKNPRLPLVADAAEAQVPF